MNYNANYSYTEGEFVRVRDENDPGSRGKKALAMSVSPGAKAPNRAHPTDAGADLHAYFGANLPDAYIEIQPGEQQLVDTGVALKIPLGYAGFVMPRSSMRAKGITSWGDGLIDSAYRGTIKIVLANQGNEVYTVKAGDRIGQIVIQQIELVEFVDIWNDTGRGTGGFGSTGK
jgi:dUTP pyrophosphatase